MLAPHLTDAGIPARGNQRSEREARRRFDFDNPDYRCGGTAQAGLARNTTEISLITRTLAFAPTIANSRNIRKDTTINNVNTGCLECHPVWEADLRTSPQGQLSVRSVEGHDRRLPPQWPPGLKRIGWAGGVSTP